MQISLDAVRDPGAGRLFSGQLISQVCDKMMSVGLVWMLTEGHPPSIIPWFLAVSALPHLLLAWSAGRWTTALGPLRTLVSTDLFRGAVFVGLSLAWPFLGGADARLGGLFAASFVANIASALFNPAIMSFPIFLADESRLQQLTSLIDSCFSIGGIAGPALAAIVYPVLGVRGLFLFNGLSYVVAAALEAGIRTRIPEPSSDQAGPAAPDPAGAILRSDSLVAWMLGGFLASNLFLTPLMVFLPLFVKARYHGAIQTLAALESTMGIGTVIGSVVLSAVRLDSRLGTRICAGMGVVAAAYVAFALTSAPLAGAAALGVLGFALSATNVFSMTFFQTRVEERNVPTLMSLVNLISVASLPVSMTVMGLVTARADIGQCALVCSAALALVTAIVVSRPQLRALT